MYENIIMIYFIYDRHEMWYDALRHFTGYNNSVLLFFYRIINVIDDANWHIILKYKNNSNE